MSKTNTLIQEKVASILTNSEVVEENKCELNGVIDFTVVYKLPIGSYINGSVSLFTNTFNIEQARDLALESLEQKLYSLEEYVSQLAKTGKVEDLREVVNS